MRTFVSFFLIVITLNIFSQERGNPKQILHEVNNKAIVQSVYPNAEKVEKVNNLWFRILDKKGKTIAFAMSSTDYCKNVIGYANNTPVLIITDLKFIIKKVALLSNYESPGYVNRLVRNGFFDIWNNKTIKKAKSVEIDAYTGATYTAKSVGQNVKFLLENGVKKLPKK